MGTSGGGLPTALRRARETAGLSQTEAAARAGLHKVSISRWENGRRAISTPELSRLAKAYGTTVGALMGEESQPATPPRTTTPPQREATGAVPDELRLQPAYWRGRQDELVGMMEHIGRMMREATTMHDRALETQRQIIAYTTPTPHSDEAPIPPELMVDAEPEAAPAKRRKRRGA